MNLLADDLQAEVLLTLDAEGEPRLYYSKQREMGALVRIAFALVQSGINMAREHGITLGVDLAPGKRLQLGFIPGEPGTDVRIVET